MNTYVSINKMEIESVDDIKSLYERLKDARIVKNWDEFSKRIDYDRTYVSRVVNGHEPLSPDLINAIVKEFINPTKNVSSADIWLKIPEPEFQKLILEELRQLKATANILKLTVAKNSAKINNESPGIEGEYQAILKLIDAEADRLLELDKKKYGAKPPDS